MKSETAEHGAIVAAKTATYSGAAGAVVSGLTISEFGVIVGIAVGVLGLLLGQFWAWRRDKREERKFIAEMKSKHGTGWDRL